jgi:hypothetical protein
MDRRRRWLVLLPIVIGTCLLLTAVVLILIVGIRSLSSATQEENAGMPFSVVEITPTPQLDVSTVTPPPACQTVISSGDVEAAVPLPVSLTVADLIFSVVPVVPEAGQWTGPASSESAVWVCGSVVNYLVQLLSSAENEALLTAMEPGTPIALTLSDGIELQFRFSGRQQVAAYDPPVLVQSRPMVSLIVPAEDGTWQVATGAYVVEAETPPRRPLANVDQPIRVGNIELLVVRGHTARDQAFLGPGDMVFLVEYTVENLGTDAIDSDGFVQFLQDSAGNQYSVSPQASRLGDYGVLTGPVAPGQTVQATAGYIVPEALPGPAVVWTFSPGSAADPQAHVSIPHRPAVGPEATGEFLMVVTDAFLSSDGTTLVIEGEIRNAGNGPVTIELADISLTSSAGLSVLRAAAPPLPWTVAAGQTQIVELQYSKPDAAAALLTVGGYSFEIEGLR